ncbi:uncharacterized protein LOC128922413 [Zeugodacus cucurbitae]|uniref:uncharacterized protein LOC128922413 n=1 Tax=Zeugodacus cucurbitae TaxID=28588 RepID=UPI0023D915A9|nr:uncharacterized protein LOC128922413 [Zeugodacus cucurbitae]
MQHCKFLICLATLVTNYSLLIDFVEYRHNVKPLDGLLIFQANTFSSDGIERELQDHFRLPQIIVNNVATLNVQNFINIRSIALIFMEKLDQPRTWMLVSKILRARSFIPMIFVSLAVPSMDVQLKFFNYFRQLNILNTVVLFRENDTMMTNNRTELRGLNAHLLSVFLKRVNGTSTVMSHPINETTIRTIDMSANLVFRIDLIHRSMAPSYPVFQTKACLMLPVEPGIPVSWYLVYAFDISTWHALGFTFIAIALLKITINRNHSNSDLVLHGLSVLQLFLAQSVLLPGIRAVTRALFVIYFGVLFVVIVSVYGGSLTSLFSTRVRMPAVRTAEDFLKTGLMIMATDNERQLYFDAQLLPTSLESRIYNVGSGAAAIDRTIANTSFAYIMTRYKWFWYKKPQNHLENPVFRMASGSLCTPSLLQAFALQRQSPFRELLKILCLELQQLGFVDHWLAEVPPAVKFQLSNETGMSEVPLSLSHFTLGFHVLGVGWIIALVTFVGELIVSRRREIFASRVIKRLGKLGGK